MSKRINDLSEQLNDWIKDSPVNALQGDLRGFCFLGRVRPKNGSERN